ncbi:MAG: DeoR/GlpR family DNA-binding transcription regulator [Tissierellia bacterium]|nr:DeoR/GlpR family DNA-binding transcription regulator [Tissierellia bacterium]
MKNRNNEILKILSDKKKIGVKKLSEILGVSQVTMRKDLDALSERGLIIREHGFAILKNTDDISGRLAYNYEEKRAIALKACEMVNDGDTLMIESGSTCAILARMLSETKNNLTIITNSVFISNFIRDNSNFQLILTGGIFQNNSQCLIGPMIEDIVKQFHVQYLFIGADGYSKKTGFTNKDQLRAQAVRDMSNSCDEIVVLTQSEKFKQTGAVSLKLKNKKMTVITDKKINQEEKQLLIGKNYKLITV